MSSIPSTSKMGMGLGVFVLSAAVVIGVIAFFVWGIPAIKRKIIEDKLKKAIHTGPGPVRGTIAAPSEACYNENLISAQAFGVTQKGGNVAACMSSAPLGSKAVALATSSMKTGPRTTPIDLSSYSRMGQDRTLAAVGLDAPEDLALASAQLGHLEFAGSTRMDTWDVRGETPSSWVPSYTADSSGRLQPGGGAYIPDGANSGPYALAQRPVGPVF